MEEFDDFGIGNTYKNSIYGGVAGAIYKSTRGVRPMCLGAVLGAGLGSSYAYIYKKNFFLYWERQNNNQDKWKMWLLECVRGDIETLGNTML